MSTPHRTFLKRSRKGRICRHCKELFIPDPRNRHHQRYCSKQQCRKASKRSAQKRWLSSSKGNGYFSGTDNVLRVQQWRESHPGYWKKKAVSSPVPLQDLLNTQGIDNKREKTPFPLQDLCLLQPALLIGLIATFTGNTLQDDIVHTARRLINSGQDILGGNTAT